MVGWLVRCLSSPDDSTTLFDVFFPARQIEIKSRGPYLQRLTTIFDGVEHSVQALRERIFLVNSATGAVVRRGPRPARNILRGSINHPQWLATSA